jgi:hypothetical protein
MEDLKTPERLIVTDTTRVYAVVEDETVKADETEGYVFA